MPVNCWGHHKCGREPHGMKVEEHGVCPAANATFMDGVNNGKNAGRSCWTIAGTFCEGKPKGSIARKLNDCRKCSFFKRVKEEEGDSVSFVQEI